MALHQFETPARGVVARPTDAGPFQTRVDFPSGPIIADEPVEVGGLGSGPTPYELLAAGLAACTAMTMRLYAGRKQWQLPPFAVEVAHSLVPGDPPRDRFARHIIFETPVDPERRSRLLEIADRCPVHRTLARGFEIVTSAGDAPAPISADPLGQHVRDMEQACEG